MAEPVNGGTGSQPPKEMSMEVRLLLAFILMGAVMFVSQYFLKPQAPPPAQKTAQSTDKSGEKSSPAAAVVPPKDAPPAEAEPEAKAAPVPGATPQQTLPPLVVETDLYRVTFSNQGANVRSWLLKKYKGNDNKPLELLNTASGLEFPFSLYFPGQKPAKDVNWAWYTQTPDPDGLGVSYEFSDGHTAVHKSFRFEKTSFLSKVTTEVTLDGKPVPHMIEWRGGFGDLTIANPSANQRTLYFDVAENKLREKTVRDAKSGPLAASGNFSFAGIADTYFAAVFLPEGNNRTVEVVTVADTAHTPVADEKPAQFPGVAVSEGTENRFELFVGPKDLDLLGKVNPKLVQVVDFGWLSVLAKPLFLVVNWFNDAFVHNFGWAIVLVTVVINFMLFPLKLSNMKSMRKMQALKPQIDAINAKYKSLKMTDPRKQEQQQETMDLYKKNGVNPMGGCVPMLLQLPFFFAFYKVFTVSVEMRCAPWLWVTDLSQPEHLPIKILPLVMIGSQFLMQKMTPQAGTDPSQQKMMMFMPLVFGYMFYWFPSGLVLYYLTSNLVSMGQQWFFNKTETAQAAARSVEVLPKKKNGRK
jgi:YidC/Oxa1 family membrane protein insertase